MLATLNYINTSKRANAFETSIINKKHFVKIKVFFTFLCYNIRKGVKYEYFRQIEQEKRYIPI